MIQNSCKYDEFGKSLYRHVPLIDFSVLPAVPPVPTNSEDPNVSGLDSSKGDDDNASDTGESSIPVIKKLPIRRHSSDPLTRKINRPVIKRHNTR